MITLIRRGLPVLWVLLLSVLTGCASTMHRNQEVVSHLHNLETGEVTEMVLETTGRNRSRILRSQPGETGETFEGEFVTTGRRDYDTGVRAGYYSGGGWSLGLDVTRWLGGSKEGSAVLTGSDGTIIDISYIISGGNAQGRGSDNKGGTWRFQCCNQNPSGS